MARSASSPFSVQVVAEPAPASELVWAGDGEAGTPDAYMQFPTPGLDAPAMWHVVEHRRPVDYGGDGSGLRLVDSPVRSGTRAFRFGVPDMPDDAVPDECDPAGDNCERRRAEVAANSVAHAIGGSLLPYREERFVTISYFVPDTWSEQGSSWGPLVMQLKPIVRDGSVSPTFAIGIETQSLDGQLAQSWMIHHRHHPDPIESWAGVTAFPWQYGMFYNGAYPSDPSWPNAHSAAWDDGLPHWVDGQASRDAMASILRGGWTDWIIHLRPDARGEAAGGTGFLRVYKREESGLWLPIIDVAPQDGHERGGMTWDLGIGYDTPGTDAMDSGFYFRMGMYMAREQVVGTGVERSIVIDNARIFSGGVTLDQVKASFTASPPLTWSIEQGAHYL